MAEVTGILESVVPKEGRTGTYFIVNVNGTEGSTFDGALGGKAFELVGQQVKAYFVQKGKFTNVADVQPLNGEAGQSLTRGVPYVSPGSPGPDRDERIRRQWAVNAAIAYSVGTSYTLEDIFGLADKMQEYATRIHVEATQDEDIPWPS